jgi:hypothetical protein
LAPDVEEHLADQILRRRLVTHQPQDKSEDPHVMPGEQHLHRKPITICDPANEDFVRSGLVRRQ